MINNFLLDILKRKIESEEILVEDIKNDEYKAVIQEWLNSKTC